MTIFKVNSEKAGPQVKIKFLSFQKSKPKWVKIII